MTTGQYPIGHVRPDGYTFLEWRDDEQRTAVISRELLEELVADQNTLRHIKRILNENSVGWALD